MINNVEYAQVLRMLGNGRLEAFCFDGVKRLCHIRGKLRKKVWVNQVIITFNYYCFIIIFLIFFLLLNRLFVYFIFT